ncbi:MAG TPA: hypothetical protein VFQ40_01175 [Actinomycetota bacterium]|nr:hypothetical protein [Actinomycetota bacterium]
MSVAPARPDEPAGAVRPARRWLPVWVVLGVIAVSVLGGFVTAAALPAGEARPITVGGAITVRPLPGWAVVRREDVASIPTASGGTVEASFAQLSRGSGALDVVAIAGLGVPPDRAAAFYVEAVLRAQLERPSVSALRPGVLPRGLPAVRFAYIGIEPTSGDAIEGNVTVTVGRSGVVAVFDGWGSEGQLELIAEELETMVGDAQVT